MTASLSTHILDISLGKPAAKVRVQLWRCDKDRVLITETTTNRDGRTDAPLIQGDAFKAGEYELLFFMGDYFAENATGVASLYDQVPIRIVAPDTPDKYHIPLLVSPFGYSTYRGS